MSTPVSLNTPPVLAEQRTEPPRLLLFGGSRAIERALRALWNGVIERVSWQPAGWQIPADLRSGDAVVLWLQHADAETLRVAAALHDAHSRVPLLARVGIAADTAVPSLLGVGVHEVFSRTAQFSVALARARTRVELLARRTGLADPARGAAGYEGLFPNLYDWIYVIGVAEDGGLTFDAVNPPLHTASDFLNPDYVGLSPDACLARDRAATLTARVSQLLAEGLPLQFEEEQHGNRGTAAFQTILTPIRNKWGRIHRIAGISRDVTLLREAQAALQESEERLALALEGTQQGLWDWDLTRDVVYRSPRWFEMLGLPPESLKGTLQAGLDRVHVDDRPGVEQALTLHLEGHLPRFQAEYRIRTASGEWLWLFDAGKVVSWTSTGAPARIAGLCTDITERRRAEESLRALVGGVVHEMRNPAFGIGMNLDALEATFGDAPEYRPFVSALRDSCSRILDLMNDLREYGEPRTLRFEPCRVRTVADEAAAACRRLAVERSCTLLLDFEDDDMVLPLHAFRMQQVFRNLIENALYHAPAESTVRLTSRRDDRAGQAWALFSVEDEGPGFDAEALARAFEPFFTQRRQGTGLGLSIVRRVVEEHGGTVVAANRAGAGAIVTMRLPIARAHDQLRVGAPGGNRRRASAASREPLLATEGM